VAFFGRSNVGKSSLINALTRKKLARTSKTPGRTQQVNYFALTPKKGVMENAMGYIVDLPGYGYAKAPDQKVSAWQKNTQDFLLGRRDIGVLKKIYLLVDSRVGVTSLDRVIMGWFDEAAIPYSIVLTKADSASPLQIIKIVNQLSMRFFSQIHGNTNGSQGPVINVTSAKTNQ